MNYGQFLNMIPEATLTLILILVFLADFAFHKSESKHKVLSGLAITTMILQIIPCFMAEPVSLFGGLYATTAAGNVMKIVMTMATAIVVIMSQEWLSREDIRDKEGEYYMLVISTLLGMYMMISSGNFLMFFLGLEMASIPMACLVALDKKSNESAEAGAKYILMAMFSSGIMLYGLSLIYGSVGTLYFEDVAAKLQSSSNNALNIMGLVCFFSGLGFKISLVPFHYWTADTYQGAPTNVTGYLSVVSKGAAAFALIAILMKVFGSMVEQWQYMIEVVIVLSITIANLFALKQKNLKRFMAFSSISQAGYVMLAVLANNQYGVTALTYYILCYVVANLAVFAVISAIEENNNGTVDMDAYNGLYKTNPKLSLLMTLALFSLAGIPPFAGMFSKFFGFMAAASTQNYWIYIVLFIALVNTIISLFYYLMIVKAMYIKDSESPLPYFKTKCSTKVALTVCTAGVLLCGVCSCIYDWIFTAQL